MPSTPSKSADKTTPPAQPAAPPPLGTPEGGSTAPPKPEAPRGPKKGIEEFLGAQAKPAPPSEKPPTATPPVAQAKPPAEEPPKPPPGEAPDTPPTVEDLMAEVAKPKPKADAPPAESVGVAQLRKALERTKAELDESRGEVKRKLADYEATLKTVREERDRLAQEVKNAAFERSDEYRQNYLEPMEKMLAKTYKLVQKLPADAGSRMGKPEDVNDLFRLWRSDPAQALNRSRELFDSGAQVVIEAISDIADAQDKASEAVETWKTTAKQRESESKIEAEQRHERLEAVWAETISKDRDERPELFNFDADPELKPLADKASALAEMAFRGAPNLAPEQFVKLQASVRNMAAAFPAVAKQLYAARERIEQLEKQLGEATATPSIKAGKAADSSSGKSGKTGLGAIDEYFT